MTEDGTITRGLLTRAQVERLLSPIDPNHVEKKRGMSYIAQHQARAEMTRIFGVGNWDSVVESMEMVYESRLEKGDPQYPEKGDGKPYYVACYRARVTVNIRDYFGLPIATFTEYHVEENAPLPNRGEAHAMAVTSVESYALRRALIGLGDRLGLGLYESGRLDPLVRGTLQLTDPDSPLYRGKNQAPAASGSKEEPPTDGSNEEAPGAKHQGAFKKNGD